MPEVTKEKESFYYEQTGNPNSPETLVFVHGATMTGGGLLPFAAQFAEYNCITVDLPGHGHSIGETRTTVEAFADSVIYLVEELQKSKVASETVTLLGFSMGGCITVEISIRKPSWLKRAVVLSSGADLRGNTPLVSTFNAMSDSEFRCEDLYPHLGGRYTTKEELASESEVMTATKCEDAIGLSDLRTAGDYSRQADVAKIDVPLLIIAGDDDKIVPVNISIRLRDGVQGSEMLILPYRGHSAIYEEIETAAKTIKSFIQFHPLQK